MSWPARWPPKGYAAVEDFDCPGCGRHMVRLVGPPTELCGACMVLGAVRNRLVLAWQAKLLTDAEFNEQFLAAPGPPP